MRDLWHCTGDAKNQFSSAVDQYKPLGLDRNREEQKDQLVVWPHNTICQQQSKNGTGGANRRVYVPTEVLHHQLDDSRAEYADEVVLGKFEAAPQFFDRQAKHPQGKHVKKQVVEAAMQKAITDQLPRLKVTAM